ncbi:MAG: 4'-phosphopantetheinyl transferase superfamily protein [Candidatus Sungbacteria bacterium]|nr:4'-phosphopantetheinyl transferase superfamily protein [Candidatus Sungbacteria bacterium]
MVGIDLVFMPEFKKRLETVDLHTILLDSELRENRLIESLAGLFAAKEAFFKALGRKADWHEVWIEKDKEGKPRLQSLLLPAGSHAEVSIAHSGDYAVAVVILNFL